MVRLLVAGCALVILPHQPALSPWPPPPPTPDDLVDFDGLERMRTAAAPDGWAVVSYRTATFAPPEEHRLYWLATLKPERAGDAMLVIELDHVFYGKPAAARYKYRLMVAAAGTRRVVSDPFAGPQCCVGDTLVIPLPISKGDRNHRFTFTTTSDSGHILGRQYGQQGLSAAPEEPTFTLVNPAAELLRVVRAEYKTFVTNRSGTDFRHGYHVTLEAVAAGRTNCPVPVEVVPAGQPVEVWLGWRDESRLFTPPNTGGVRGDAVVYPPRWQMRVGDRATLVFRGGLAGSQAPPPPPLKLPVGPYTEPQEPYPTVVPNWLLLKD